MLVSVVAVNLVTIAADLQAGATGVGLLAGVDPRWLVAPLGAALAGLLRAGRYAHVLVVLRYLMLGFPVFGVAAVLARPDSVWLAPRAIRAGVFLLGSGADFLAPQAFLGVFGQQIADGQAPLLGSGC